MSADAIKHGTYGGYQTCVMRPEGSCDECKAASNAYMREYRAAHPGATELAKAKNAAMSRALWRLAGIYSDEFKAIYTEEFGRA